MEFKVDNVGVDAGFILICDEDYYKKYDGEVNDSDSRRIAVPKGAYNLCWRIRNSWNGDVNGDGELKVTSGAVVVSDPCYCFEDHDKWIEFLHVIEHSDSSNYSLRAEEGTVILNKMGGDGCYDVEVELIECEIES